MIDCDQIFLMIDDFIMMLSFDFVVIVEIVEIDFDELMGEVVVLVLNGLVIVVIDFSYVFGDVGVFDGVLLLVVFGEVVVFVGFNGLGKFMFLWFFV